ncbi:putative Thaumatin family [Helianthus anomalus]
MKMKSGIKKRPIPHHYRTASYQHTHHSTTTATTSSPISLVSSPPFNTPLPPSLSILLLWHALLIIIFITMALYILPLNFLIFCLIKGVLGTTFTFSNKCDYTVWPGILGTPALDTTGFELARGKSRSIQAPAGWSGRFWGRTRCNFDGLGHGSCATGDCGSGQMECNGAGAAPPATLAEFTLGSGSGTQDFYDVSLVDGYNIQMIVEVSGGSGGCGTTGCVDDLNQRCPSELRVADGGGCKSACDTFGTPEYCCQGAFSSPAACRPTAYSALFKSACPKSYSYAFDDATSTFTCTGAEDYTVVFCPSIHSDSIKWKAGNVSQDSLNALYDLYARLASASPVITNPCLLNLMLGLVIYVISIWHTSFLML